MSQSHSSPKAAHISPKGTVPFKSQKHSLIQVPKAQVPEAQSIQVPKAQSYSSSKGTVPFKSRRHGPIQVPETFPFKLQCHSPIQVPRAHSYSSCKGSPIQVPKAQNKEGETIVCFPSCPPAHTKTNLKTPSYHHYYYNTQDERNKMDTKRASLYIPSHKRTEHKKRNRHRLHC